MDQIEPTPSSLFHRFPAKRIAAIKRHHRLFSLFPHLFSFPCTPLFLERPTKRKRAPSSSSGEATNTSCNQQLGDPASSRAPFSSSTQQLCRNILLSTKTTTTTPTSSSDDDHKHESFTTQGSKIRKNIQCFSRLKTDFNRSVKVSSLIRFIMKLLSFYYEIYDYFCVCI